MKKHCNLTRAISVLFLLISLCSCSDGGEANIVPPVSPNPADISGSNTSGEVVVSFDFEKQSGHASNQFAVWIEDVNGRYIKTLYATRFTANGGYKNRPDSISIWVEKSNIASMKRTDVDAITGATPKAGKLSYAWDLTDMEGNAVALGEYKFFVEGSLRWKNRIVYSGVINIGDTPATIEAEAQYFYEASNGQPALTDTSPENRMIGAVTASFTPILAN